MLHETTKSQPNRIHLMFNIRLFEAGVWTSKISLWVELHSTMQKKKEDKQPTKMSRMSVSLFTFTNLTDVSSPT